MRTTLAALLLATVAAPSAARAGQTIVTQLEFSAISPSNFDWVATLDGYESGEPIGRGETEEEAINDLMDQLGEGRVDVEP